MIDRVAILVQFLFLFRTQISQEQGDGNSLVVCLKLVHRIKNLVVFPFFFKFFALFVLELPPRIIFLLLLVVSNILGFSLLLQVSICASVLLSAPRQAQTRSPRCLFGFQSTRFVHRASVVARRWSLLRPVQSLTAPWGRNGLRICRIGISRLVIWCMLHSLVQFLVICHIGY